MRVYGRVVPRRVRIDPDMREEQLEWLEEHDVQSEDMAPEDLREPDPRPEFEPESAGTNKRPTNEHLRRQRYLP